MKKLTALALATALCLTAASALALSSETVIEPAWPVPEYVTWLLEVARGELGYTEGARGWTNGDGWFTWTQARMDEVMARYRQTLEDIRSGLLVSRTVDGSDDIVISAGNTEVSIAVEMIDNTQSAQDAGE